MQLTYKYRLNPNKAQRTALNATLDACRWVYNKTLETRKTVWEERSESVSLYDTMRLIPAWKAERPCLTQAYSQCLQNSSMRVDLALKTFFRSRHRYDSFTFPAREGWKFATNGRLRLFKIGDVKIKLHHPIEGEIKTLTIRRDTLGNWYACFSCEVEFEKPEPTPWSVGIDMGLARFATLSTGVMIDNPRFFRKDEKALTKAQRKLSALPKGTKERNKSKRVVQHIHARIATRRKDFAHKLSRYLADTFQVVVFEDLNTKGMIKLHSLAKSIGDAAWNQLIQFVTYKAAEAGRTVVLVNPAYTSQDCSQCGDRVKKALNVRVHRCPTCGLAMDRDLNASLNILARGLAGIGSNP